IHGYQLEERRFCTTYTGIAGKLQPRAYRSCESPCNPMYVGATENASEPEVGVCVTGANGGPPGQPVLDVAAPGNSRRPVQRIGSTPGNITVSPHIQRQPGCFLYG